MLGKIFYEKFIYIFGAILMGVTETFCDVDVDRRAATRVMSLFRTKQCTTNAERN